MKLPAENILIWVLLLVAIIVPLTRLFGNLSNRLGQPRVIGEIFSGVMLGILINEVFQDQLDFISSASYKTLLVMSQVGIVILMSQLGMEFEFGMLKKNGQLRTLTLIPSIGIMGSLAVGALMGVYYQNEEALPFSISLMILCGILFSVTALPVLGRILVENRMQKTSVGVTAMSVAVLTDITSWIMVGGLIIFSNDQSILALIIQIGAFGLLVGVLVGIIRPLFFRYLSTESKAEWALFSLIFVVFITAVIMESIGFCAVLGGFLAGVSLYHHKQAKDHMEAKIMPFVNTVLVPIFFTVTGMRIDLGSLSGVSSIYWLLVFVGMASFSKIAFSAIAAKICDFTTRDSLKIGVLVNTKGLMELIVLNIAYDLGIISGDLFSIMVLLAILTTVLTSPLLRLIDIVYDRQSRLLALHKGESASGFVGNSAGQ